MWRSLAASLSTIAVATAAALAQAGAYQGVYFTMPPGWISGMQEGRFQIVPTDMTQATAVVVVLSGAEKLNGKSLDEWFRAKMADDLNPQVKALQEAQVQSGRSGAFQTRSAGRTVQDPGGRVRLQLYYTMSDGQQAGLATVVTASEAAMNKYIGGVQALFQSLRFSAAPNEGASLPASGARASAGDASRGQSTAGATSATTTKSQITVADVTGSWSHSTSSYADYVNSSTGGYAGSSTIAYGQGYDFAADGTYKYLFTGMINSRYIKETDSGTWGFESGNLVVRSRERASVKVYQIVGYQTAPDGAVFMTLLAGDYRRTEGNIALYGEKYVRKPPSRGL